VIVTVSTNVECITSDYMLEDIETHFKITAGPGAGKTYWLVEHIKNVLKNSTMLLSTSKIACITYTNVAVEEIQQRLEITGNRVEVSTIHSFLYNNIVKPYVYLLKDETGECLVNYKEMDGHDDHVPSKGKINIWKRENNLYGTIKDDKKLNDCLKNLDWVFEGEEIVLTTREDYKRKVGYFIRKEYFPSYKKLYWNEGTIHHEDVLYFSYLILEKHPMILQFISARYPYIFIDEFQDTSPMQTRIIKLLANSGVVIGVIGDPAQSIFKFNGAARQEFLDFELPKQKNFSMDKNRRSTNKIIDFLNHLRNSGGGFQQEYHRNVDGTDICLVTGESSLEIIKRFKVERESLGLKKTYCMITRRNESVVEFKSCIDDCKISPKIWDDLYTIDSKRYKFLDYLFMAQEYARDKRYEIAVKEILKIFRVNKEGYLREPFNHSIIEDKLFKRSYSIALLESLVNSYETNLDKTLYQFYNEILYNFFNEYDLTLKKLTGSGKFKKKSEKVTVRELVNSLKIREVKTNDIRTIHKAKGAEFESVLVYFNNASEMNKIINPDIDNENDDHRLYYVALSRAEDFLCVATNSIEDEQVENFKQLNIRVL
jgi:DNA helicase II / ATP-dependent DNA helicase PcrA